MKVKNTSSIMSSIALITGIAVGAVIGALFAPKSGKETRKNVAGTIKGMLGISMANKEVEIKDHLVDDLRIQTREAADRLTGASGDLPDLTKTTVKQKGPKSRQLPIES
jgi:gas vesicle protein